jgi:hypothetical protein
MEREMKRRAERLMQALLKRVVELEAENKDLEEANLPLYSDRIKNLSRIAELEAEQQDFHDKILGGMQKIETLEAERDRLALKVQQWEEVSRLFGEIFETTEVPARIVKMEAENALLRKALEDAPHDYNCDALPRYSEILGIPPGPIVTELPPRGSCNCWKATLARSPEEKP